MDTLINVYYQTEKDGFMYSHMEDYLIFRDGRATTITLTAQRMSNDMDGNPRHKVHVWTNQSIWSPKVKGFRRSKDDSYVLKSTYNLTESMSHFVKLFEESINES
jgi:hypothetical protein